MSDTTSRPAMLAAEALERTVEHAAVVKAARPVGRMFALAVFAGAFISFGAAFMLVVRSDGSLGFAVSQLLGGLVFCLGLFLVLCAGAELFTGNSLMLCGALSRRVTVPQMLRCWAVVYLGNALGALCVASLLVAAGFLDANGGAVGTTALSVALTKAGLAPSAMFVRGILCNVLVCLAVWTSFTANTPAGKLACALLPVVGFVVMGFEHSVANMFFLPLGLIAQATGALGATELLASGVAMSLVLVTLGNIVGGLIVGAGYWLAFHTESG